MQIYIGMKFMSNKWSFKFHLHFICSSHAIINFHLKMVFSDITKNYVQLTEKWNSIKLMVSVAAVQTYF